MKRILYIFALMLLGVASVKAYTEEMATQTARETWWYFNSVINQPTKSQYGFSVKLINGSWLTGVKLLNTEEYHGVTLSDSGLTNHYVSFLDSSDILDWAFVDRKYLIGGFSFRLDYAPTPDRKMLCSFLGANFVFAEAVNKDFMTKSKWDLEAMGIENNEKSQIKRGLEKKDLFSSRFKGGMDAFYRFLNDHIIYPPFAYKIGLEGYTYVQFDFLPSGKIDNVVVLQSIGAGSREMSEAVIRKLPPLKPRRHASVETILLPIKLVLN